MAAHGEIQRPPLGRFNGRLWENCMASERYEASDALHREKGSGYIQADMTYGELVVWLRQRKNRWRLS
jgi:hypothetical protein